MTTTIFNQNYGRALHSYDLLDRVQDAYGMSRREAHDSIHAMLSGLLEDDSNLILDTYPARMEREHNNSQSLDRDMWLVVSDETAQTIFEALATTA
jgi:hypothetical protein